MLATLSNPVESNQRTVLRALLTRLECAAIEMRDALRAGRCTNPADVAACARSLHQWTNDYGPADEKLLRQSSGETGVELCHSALDYGKALEHGNGGQQWKALLNLIRCCLSVA